MIPELYKQKLISFNTTDKYLSELDMLNRLLNAKIGDRVMDYGCGIGTAVRYIREKTIAHVYGYDVSDYCKGNAWFTPNLFEVDKTYFMHSIAHIQYVSQALKDLKSKEVVVITPNKDWLELNRTDDYIPDPTVFQHYNLTSLTALFTLHGYKIAQSGQFGSVTEGVCERIFLIATK